MERYQLVPQGLSAEPRLEFDLAHEGVDLSKAQRVDIRLYGAGVAPAGADEPGSAPPPRDGKAAVG